MNLSDKAKELVLYLAENARQRKIATHMQLLATVNGGNAEKVYIPIEGAISEDFETPSVKLLEELASNRLIRLNYGVKLNLFIQQALFDAVESNFGESREQPKGQLIGKPYKGLTKEQWNFLIHMAKALRGGFLTNITNNGQFFIMPIIMNDTIIEFDYLNKDFLQVHKEDLKISLKVFIDLVSNGYFQTASGGYYLVKDKILTAVDDYLSQDDKPRTVPGSSAFRLPDSSPQFQCDIFMVMPFLGELKPVYTDHIRPLAEGLGYSIKRGDDTFSQHDIITEIWSLINNAKLIIADCTGKNANVFYEMGLAHAIDKPVIVITKNEEDIPFDIRQRRYIKYVYNPRGMKQFEEDLKKAIQSILGS